MDAALIDQYEAGPRKLRECVRGLSDQSLRSFPVPGSWSLHQLVLHLQDSDLIMAERMKRVIAEDQPQLLAFDHDGFMDKLELDAQSSDDALTLIELQRKQMAAILRRLPEATSGRIGIHSQRGPLTLADLVKFAISHLEHHMKFAAQKRTALNRT